MATDTWKSTSGHLITDGVLNFEPLSGTFLLEVFKGMMVKGDWLGSHYEHSPTPSTTLLCRLRPPRTHHDLIAIKTFSIRRAAANFTSVGFPSHNLLCAVTLNRLHSVPERVFPLKSRRVVPVLWLNVSGLMSALGGGLGRV